MKIITIVREDGDHLGVKKEEGGIIDVTEALQALPHPNVPGRVMDLIHGGDAAVAAISEFLTALEINPEAAGKFIYEENDVTLAPCVTEPGKIICIGLNYRKHAEETNMPIPRFPILFSKFSNTLAGHREDIPLPTYVTDQVDYEAELVLIIGKEAKDVPKEQALSYVFGYCCGNDLSARDLQMRTNQWLLGKTCDKFCPIGPYLVTAGEIENPNDLEISCTVNGEVRQMSNTSDMIFACDELVSYISRHMTLQPGDLILTGTPEGVILGYPEEKRVYLKPGDEVSVTIGPLGTLTNRMAVQ